MSVKRLGSKLNFLPVLLFLWYTVPVVAQTFSLQFPEELLSARLKKISEKSGNTILADERLIGNTRVPELKMEKATVEQMITRSLEKTPFTFSKSSATSYVIIRTGGNTAPKGAPGEVKGRVVETETSEPLPGATVKLTDTSYGAITNAEGYYTLPRVPSGKYTMEISYIGFSTARQQVQIVAGRANTYDVKMSADGEMLNEVTVSAVRKQRGSVPHMTEKLLVNEMKQLSVVASGISSEQISKTADRNAAQAVAKVSGVSLVDDKFVIIRGLNPRYNLTYLNDNVAPSTETNSRSFALDLIPSRVIDKIVVYKSPSPENQADATGGVIKVYTKDAKTVRHLDLEFQLGYRSGTTFKSDFLTYKGGKTDFLGFDDGTRALPSSVPKYGSLVKAQLTPSQYVKTFNSTLSYGKKTALPNMQLTINYYDAWNVFGKTLSILTSLSYKNDNQKQSVYKQEGAPYRSVEATDKISYNNRNTNTVQLNLLQNFTLTFNENNRMFFKNFLLQQGIDAVVDRISHPTFQGNQNNNRNKDITLSYNERFLYAGNLGGEHFFSKNKHHLQWNAGYTFSKQETPDQRVMRFKGIKEADAFGSPELLWIARGYNPKSSDDLDETPLSLGIISRLWSRNSEGVYNGSLDYTFKPTEWLSIKMGTFHQWKKRELYRRVYTVHEGNVDPSSSFYNRFKNNYVDVNLVRFRLENLNDIWTDNYLNDNYTGLYVLDRTSGSDMYEGTEQNNASYLALTLTPKKWIEIHGGLRYEYNRQKIGAATPPTGGIGTVLSINKPILVDHAAALWLPSINLSFKPSEKWIFRVAYGKTVNRTEFREVSPFKELDFENNTVLQGNPDLVSANVENYDLRLEFYPNINKGDAITVGAFYKDIQNPIERINTSNRVLGEFPSISYQNATSARVSGLEFEVRKSLDFIPGGLFRNISFAGNLSIIRSKAKFDNNNKDFLIKKRPLQGQAPYLLNTGLYYDNAGLGSKIAVIYNYVSESIYAAGKGEKYNDFIKGSEYRGSLIELPRHLLDFSYTQRIGKGLQLKFAIQNILNAKTELAEDFNFTNKYEHLVVIPSTEVGHLITYEGDNIASSYRPGRLFNLSISYSF